MFDFTDILQVAYITGWVKIIWINQSQVSTKNWFYIHSKINCNKTVCILWDPLNLLTQFNFLSDSAQTEIDMEKCLIWSGCTLAFSWYLKLGLLGWNLLSLQVKCEQYWPDQGMVEFGKFKVSLVDSQKFADYTIRILSLVLEKVGVIWCVLCNFFTIRIRPSSNWSL